MPVPKVLWGVMIIAGLLAIAGFAGIDPRLHAISETLNRPGPPDPTDFYHRTARLWDVLRWPAHWSAAAAAVAALALWHPRGPRVAVGVLIVFFAVAITANGLQSVFGRLRPVPAKAAAGDRTENFHLTFEGPRVDSLYERKSYGFPSGEASVGFAMATALALALPRWTMLWLLLALLVCCARLVAAAHYLSDVSTGALFGVASALAILSRFNRAP